MQPFSQAHLLPRLQEHPPICLLSPRQHRLASRQERGAAVHRQGQGQVTAAGAAGLGPFQGLQCSA